MYKKIPSLFGLITNIVPCKLTGTLITLGKTVTELEHFISCHIFSVSLYGKGFFQLVWDCLNRLAKIGLLECRDLCMIAEGSRCATLNIFQGYKNRGYILIIALMYCNE